MSHEAEADRLGEGHIDAADADADADADAVAATVNPTSNQRKAESTTRLASSGRGFV